MALKKGSLGNPLNKVTSKLRGAYFFFEDKWYALLDKINPKIPVYKVVDPIDKVIPSFIVFLLVILFLVILVGYLIQYSSPYDVVFNTYDSVTNDSLAGVQLSGVINDQPFEDRTDAGGMLIVPINGPAKNFYGMLFQSMFGGEDEFSGFVNASKNGYQQLRNQQIDNSTEIELYLEPEAEPPPSFANSARVNLKNSESKAVIIDSSNRAYVKFKCDNKTLTEGERAVRDNTDGSLDGIFTLTETNCDFVVTKAWSPDYDAKNISEKIVNPENIYSVELTEKETPTTGTAKIRLFKKGTNKQTSLSGITVTFVANDGTTDSAVSVTGGNATKELSAGHYVITIMDDNYYAITPDNNYSVDIVVDQQSYLEIELEEIPVNEQRRIYFKLMGAQDTNVLGNAEVALLWLVKDGNSQSGIGSNGTPLFEGSAPTHSDENGFYKLTGLSAREDGNLLVIAKAVGYVYKIFKPTFFTSTGGPETITVDKSLPQTSGSAGIEVVAGDNNRPLENATTYIYFSISDAGKEIGKIPVPKGGKLTNNQGKTQIIDLPAGPGNYYSASAAKGGVFSGVTPKKGLDVGQTINFKIKLNLEVSQIELLLKDIITNQTINSIAQADVNVYYSNDDSFEDLVFAEKISYASGKFLSNSYEKESKLLISINAPGYLPDIIELNGKETPLQTGINSVTKKLYKIPANDCNGIDDGCTTDGNVMVMFREIYAPGDNYWSDVSTAFILNDGNSYYVRFDALLAKDLNYQTLLSMIRVGNAKITNIDFSNQYLEKADAFSCSTQSKDTNLLHTETYYFPVGTGCDSTPDIQSGYKWSNSSLKKGVYSFVARFEVDGDVNEEVVFNYRAKDTHGNISTETRLKEKRIKIGEPFRNGFRMSINLEGQVIDFFESQEIKTAEFEADTNNSLSVTLYNSSDSPINDLDVKVYSYIGNPNTFNPANPGSGYITFDGDTSKEKVLASNVFVQKYSSKTYITQATTNTPHSNNYIVVVAQYDGNTFIAFIDAFTMGIKLNLSAEFLSSVSDQLFSGRIIPATGGDTIANIQSVLMRTDINCDGLYETDYLINLTNNPTQIIGNYFENTILGTFKSHLDCLKVIVTPIEEQFEPINETLTASPHGATDASLACLQIEDKLGNEEVFMNWNEQKEIVVYNDCDRATKVRIDTEIVCEKSVGGGACNPTTGIEIAAGASMDFKLTGRNISFNASEFPNFTDILGFFPIYLAGKFSDASPGKKFTLADSMAAHLENNSQCFEISRDSFDFVEEGDAEDTIDFFIENFCQSEDFTDNGIPFANMTALGYNLKDDYPANASEDFNAALIVTGNTFETQIVDINKDTAWTGYAITARGMNLPIVDTPDRNYSNLEFDFNVEQFDNGIGQVFWEINRIQIRVIDINNEYIGIPKKFGAKVNGNITVTYANGDTVQVTPNTNLKIDPTFSCEPSDGNETCETGSTFGEGHVGDDEFTFGLFYVNLPAGRISSIKMNFTGNPDTNYLEFHVRPYLKYTQRRVELIPGGEEGTININLGRFVIPPIKNTKFIVKRVDNILSYVGSTVRNPRVYLASSNPKIVVWYEDGYIMARFVGASLESYQDGTMELRIEDESGAATTYNIINITDYVGKDEASIAGRNISGVIQ